MRAHAQLDAAREKSSQGYKQLAVDADQLRQQLEKVYNEKPIDTYIRKCDELAKKLSEGKINAGQYKEQTERLAEGLKKAGEAHEESFGGHAVTKAVEMAAAYVSIEKAVELATEAIRAHSEAKREAGERAGGELAGVTTLAQVARNPTEFAAGLAEARKLRPLVGGNAQQAEDIASKMLAAHLSESEQQSVEQSLRAHTTSGAAAGTLIENIRGYQELYGGSFDEVSRKALEVSRASGGRFSPEESLGLALRAREAGNDAKGDDILATIAEVGRTTPQARKAARIAEEVFTKGELPFGYNEKSAAAEAARIRAAGATPSEDLIAGDSRLRGARTYEESKGERELTEEELYASVERTGRAVFERRRGKAASQGAYRDIIERTNQKLDTRSWSAVLEDEERGYVAGSGRINGDAFQNSSPEQANEIRELLRELRDESRKQTGVMERGDRQPPSGRQE